MRPDVFQSKVTPTGVQFISVDVYPFLGDALLSRGCNTDFMRRILLPGPRLNFAADDSITVRNCNLAVTTDPNDTVYYSGLREIRHLMPSSQPEELS
jgi:hypothetical protein